jgi:hypothetical protein
MSNEQAAEFERQLAARGWSYDVDNQDFRDAKRVIGWREVIRLVPGLTLDDLAAWEDDRVDQRATSGPAG